MHLMEYMLCALDQYMVACPSGLCLSFTGSNPTPEVFKTTWENVFISEKNLFSERMFGYQEGNRYTKNIIDIWTNVKKKVSILTDF